MHELPTQWPPGPTGRPPGRTRRPSGRASTVVALAGLVTLLATAACSSGTGTGAAAGTGTAAGGSSGSADGAGGAGAIAVVATTNVWGDIAAQIGGSAVTVTSLISDPSQDPHEFHASGRDELAVSRADLVIENGGAYDDFVTPMYQSVDSHAPVITATEVADEAGLRLGENEHVWYDTAIVTHVAESISAALSDLDPAHANDFRHGLDAFRDALAPVRDAIDELRAAEAGTPVAATESLAGYLIHAAGLTDRTPPTFLDAAEDGIDVAPHDLQEVLALFTDRRVRALLDNEQSATAQTDTVVDAARDNDIPVVALSELLPPGEHYQDWMLDTVHRLASALAGKATV